MDKREPFHKSEAATVRSYKVKKKPNRVKPEEVAEFEQGRYALPKMEQDMIDFFYDRKKPVTKFEKQLYKEVQEIKAKGRTLDFEGEVF